MADILMPTPQLPPSGSSGSFSANNLQDASPASQRKFRITPKKGRKLASKALKTLVDASSISIASRSDKSTDRSSSMSDLGGAGAGGRDVVRSPVTGCDEVRSPVTDLLADLSAEGPPDLLADLSAEGQGPVASTSSPPTIGEIPLDLSLTSPHQHRRSKSGEKQHRRSCPGHGSSGSTGPVLGVSEIVDVSCNWGGHRRTRSKEGAVPPPPPIMTPPGPPAPDMDIGRRLALPDKLDIMTGLAPPSPPQRDEEGTGAETRHVNRVKSPDRSLSPQKSKKLLILPREGGGVNTPMSIVRRRLMKHRNNSLSGSFTNMPPPPTEAAVDAKGEGEEEQRDEIVLRSSELEPTVHQCKILPAHDFLMYARVCALMERYDRLQETRAKSRRKWFDFSALVGLMRTDLEDMYMKGTQQSSTGATGVVVPPAVPPPPPPPSGVLPQPSPSPQIMRDNPFGAIPAPVEEKHHRRTLSPDDMDKVKPPPPSIIKSLLECTDDMIVEKHFNETIGGEDGETGASVSNDMLGNSSQHAWVQATIFGSQRQRQFVVCYRSSFDLQDKPVRSNAKLKDANGEPSILHPKHPFPVNPNYRDAYFASNLETKIFAHLDSLASANPFCDVVFTGHSFGGALAIIASSRYAALKPMMTTACVGFGVPKVGGLEFRHFVNSLPNLKVMRVEHGHDPYVSQPEKPNWHHVGHTIALNAPQEGQSERSMSAKELIAKAASSGGFKGGIHRPGGMMSKPHSSSSGLMTPAPPVVAYKFDKRPSSGVSSNSHYSGHFPSMPNRQLLDPAARSRRMQGKADHEMRSYAYGLEQFTHFGLPWVTDFVGEDGEGIVSYVDQETRHVV